MASKPELFLPQDFPPDASQLYDMEQLLLFEVRHLAYQERQRKKESRVFATWLDREKGHLQQSFRRLREPPTGVLHQVHQQLTTTAEEISHNGTGLVTMKIQQKLPLRPDLQVQVQGHCATLTEYQFPIVEVMLEDADVELEREGKLQQEIATSEPVQIAEALSSFWNRYWRRDDVQRQETLEAWPEFTDLMQTLPPLPQMAVEEDDFRQWKASALSMKSQSSRGICGWYADELRFLAKAERPLRDLLRCFAHMDRFPAWMMQARIIPVKKHDQAETASAIRPITVLAMIYRYWARTTSRRMLRWWALHWPISISGFLPHRSPNHLVYHVQHEIEKIHNNIEERQLGGLTLDLIKAFNQLPQQPARALLLRLGVPQLWVTIWFNSITTMARWWHVSGSLHSAGTGTTGFPEGDPWSVNAMLTINRLWVHLIDHPDLVANSYADNWAYAVYNPEVHEEAIANTVRLTRAIRVQIDWNKTWGWSTDEQHKNALQRVANQMLPPTVTLQMVPHARELGYIMHYRRKQFRGTQEDRHQQALRRLSKLARQDLHLDVIGQLAQQAGINKALFGVHVYVPGQNFFKDLRTAIARALVPGANTNPLLALTTVTKRVQDPELYVIVQALKAARRYLHHSNEMQQVQFLRLAAQAPPLAQHIYGPAQALRHYVQRLGWLIDRSGFLHIDGFLKHSLMNDDLHTIIAYAKQAWMEDVCLGLTRKNWRNAPQIDAPATLALFAKFSDHDRKLLARECIGSFHTQTQKAKFDQHTDESCLLCGQPDSLEHRLFECASTLAVHEKFPGLVEQLLEQDPIIYHLPLVYEEPNMEFHRFLHHQMIELNWETPSQTPERRGIYYTDGSCVHPQHPGLRWAAYSITWDGATAQEAKNIDWLHMNFDPSPWHKVVALGTCPGKQTIPRAELEAIIQIVARDPQAEIVTDSAYAIHAVDKVRLAAHKKDLHHLAGFDQLGRLFDLFARTSGRPTIRKVRAHQQRVHTMSYELLRDVVGNSFADVTAKRAAQELGGPWKRDQQQRIQLRREQLRFLEQQLHFRLAHCQTRASAMEELTKPEEHEKDDLTWKQRLIGYEPSGSTWRSPQECPDWRILYAAPWGFTFCSLVWQWLATLEWPSDAPPCTGKAPIGISWLELAINFYLQTKKNIPINCATKPGTFDFRAEDTHQTFTNDTTNMWKMAQSLRRCVQCLHRLAPHRIYPAECCCTVKSLYVQVGTAHAGGLSTRPKMQLQKLTLETLHHWQSLTPPGRYPDWPSIEPTLFPWSLPEDLSHRCPLVMYRDLAREIKRVRAGK